MYVRTYVFGYLLCMFNLRDKDSNFFHSWRDSEREVLNQLDHATRVMDRVTRIRRATLKLPLYS